MRATLGEAGESEASGEGGGDGEMVCRLGGLGGIRRESFFPEEGRDGGFLAVGEEEGEKGGVVTHNYFERKDFEILEGGGLWVQECVLLCFKIGSLLSLLLR